MSATMTNFEKLLQALGVDEPYFAVRCKFLKVKEWRFDVWTEYRCRMIHFGPIEFGYTPRGW